MDGGRGGGDGTKRDGGEREGMFQEKGNMDGLGEKARLLSVRICDSTGRVFWRIAFLDEIRITRVEGEMDRGLRVL